MLKPLTHKRLSDQIFEQIRDMIYRGEFVSGQKLIPERELAKLFNVGRPAVREAIQKLIDQNLIQSKRGVGTFVLDEKEKARHLPLLKILGEDDFSIIDLLEVREALELKSAELAARRATDEDISAIEKYLEVMRREKTDGRIKMTSDISFHMNIAYAGKNKVHIHFMKNFYDIQYYEMHTSYENALQELGIDDKIWDQHYHITEAIKHHDPNQAKKWMAEHLQTIIQACRAEGI